MNLSAPGDNTACQVAGERLPSGGRANLALALVGHLLGTRSGSGLLTILLPHRAFDESANNDDAAALDGEREDDPKQPTQARPFNHGYVSGDGRSRAKDGDGSSRQGCARFGDSEKWRKRLARLTINGAPRDGE